MMLVDTNVPLRIAQIGHVHRQTAIHALERLTLNDREQFAIAPQSLYEMYVVLTRPANGNGFGYSPQQAAAEHIAARAIFEVLPETPQIYPAWESLINKYRVVGKQAHDIRLVALMIQYRVGRILTFNDADFHRFTEIDAVNPFDASGIARI